MIESYERVDKNEALKRISVLLDSRTLDALNKITSRKHLKISDVVRLSILHYSKHELEETPNQEDLSKFAKFLDGSHLVVDIELLSSLISEIERSKCDTLWSAIEIDGQRHGLYYKSIGVNEVEEILKQKEIKNWFKLRIESDNSYLLILPAPEFQKFLMYFLKGLFEAMELKVEIKQIGTRNLFIRDLSK